MKRDAVTKRTDFETLSKRKPFDTHMGRHTMINPQTGRVVFKTGALGRKLLTHVRDVMRSGNAVPEVRESTPLAQALMEITRKGMAMTMNTIRARTKIRNRAPSKTWTKT